MTPDPSSIGHRLADLVTTALRDLQSKVNLTADDSSAVGAALAAVARDATRIAVADVGARLTEQGHDIEFNVIDGEPEPDNPTTAAYRWLRLILADGDLAAAWPLTDPIYRRALVEAWVDANLRIEHPLLEGHERDELVADLAQREPRHPLWRAFCQTQLGEMCDAMGHVDVEKWGWASDPRLICVDFELVVFSDGDGPLVPTDVGMCRPSVPLQMHHTPDGWLVSLVDVSAFVLPS